MDRNPTPSNLPRDIGPEFTENDGETISADLEVEERLADWLETNRVENGLPCATLYKFAGPTGETREQTDYFKGVIPSRHEIGLEYGSGRYMLIIRNTTGSRGAKSTTIRFYLHESYNDKYMRYKRERAEKERLALGQSNVLPPALPPPQTGKESLMEAFTLVRSMQADTMNMFRPLLERLLAPPAPLPVKSPSPFEEYALTRTILKDNLKENVSMYAEMQKAIIDSRAGNPPDDDGEDLPDEKQSMFEKIIALAEPFINILAQNNMAAKMAAAGIKAAPQFKEVIRDASLARRIISYVETKEGPERASIALKNLGISKGDYMTPSGSARPSPRLPAPTVRKPPPPPPKKVIKTGPAAPAGKIVLNPKMEVTK